MIHIYICKKFFMRVQTLWCMNSFDVACLSIRGGLFNLLLSWSHCYFGWLNHRTYLLNHPFSMISCEFYSTMFVLVSGFSSSSASKSWESKNCQTLGLSLIHLFHNMGTRNIEKVINIFMWFNPSFNHMLERSWTFRVTRSRESST